VSVNQKRKSSIKIFRLTICLSSLLILTHCTRQHPVVLGSASEARLVQSNGEPDSVSKSRDGRTKLFNYPNQEVYQSSNGVVRGHYRKPTEQESDINYWRNKWAGYSKFYQTHQEGINQILEIQNTDDGSSVFFDPQISKVVRVTEFTRDQK
jgi:hypothetical protein